MEDGPADQQEEGGGSGDGEGDGDGIPGPADEGGAASFDQVGDGVDLVDRAKQAGGGDGIDDGSGIHGELAEDADGTSDISVEQADGSEETADGGAEDDESDVGEGKENDGPGRQHANVKEDRDQQDQADGGDQGGFADAGKDRSDAREVELHQHGLGGIEGVDRLGEAVEESLPEEAADHDEGRIGHAGIGHLDDARAVEEDPDEGGGDRWEKQPGVTQNALAELRLHVAAEQREGEFAGIAEFRKHLANQPPWIREAGVRGVDR